MNEKASAALSWGALGPALVVPLFGSLFYFVWLPGSAWAQAVYGLTKLFTLVYPLCFGGWKQVLRQRPSGGWSAAAVWGIASGLLICGAGTLLMMSPVGEEVRQGAEAIKEKATQLGFAQNFLLFAVFVSLFHSALEEFYWRGFVYGKLSQKLGSFASHLVAGLAFAAHHLVVTWQYFDPILAIVLALFVAIGGIIWSLFYQKQTSLFGCWLSHLCVDVFLMVVGYQLIF